MNTDHKALPNHQHQGEKKEWFLLHHKLYTELTARMSYIRGIHEFSSYQTAGQSLKNGHQELNIERTLEFGRQSTRNPRTWPQPSQTNQF